MIYVIIIILLYIITCRILFGTFQSIVFSFLHPLRFWRKAFADLSASFRKRKERLIDSDSGGIILIGGLFGTGKTANQVSYAVELFRTFSNVDIFSNVTLNVVNYTPFEYLEQILEPVPDGRFRVFVCDEFGSLFNSRNYKDCKFTEVEYITMLNQVRKERKLLLITTQRYGMVDKVFRQVAREWWECSKKWRFLLVRVYDPLELELTPLQASPLSPFPRVKFLDEEITDLYDTHEIVGKFKKYNIEITDRTPDTLTVDSTPVAFIPGKKSGLFKAKRKEDSPGSAKQ